MIGQIKNLSFWLVKTSHGLLVKKDINQNEQHNYRVSMWTMSCEYKQWTFEPNFYEHEGLEWPTPTSAPSKK